MTIKQLGGVFGRNPTFNNVTIDGELIINGSVFTGLDYEGAWNAATNTPTLTSSVGTLGQFYIVSVAGATDLNGITNWDVGDWALFNGSVWQRVEGGANGNFSTLSVSGLATFNGNAQFPDNSKAIFGAGSDLQIYHDGSNSFIDDAGTGNLQIRGTQIKLQKYTGENMFVGISDGAASMYYDNSQKIATTATGIDVTGDIVLGDSNPTITFEDGSITNLSHTVSSASDNLRLTVDVNGVDAGSRVEIFDGSTEVARFSAGAMDVTGTVTADGLVTNTAGTSNLHCRCQRR